MVTNPGLHVTGDLESSRVQPPSAMIGRPLGKTANPLGQWTRMVFESGRQCSVKVSIQHASHSGRNKLLPFLILFAFPNTLFATPNLFASNAPNGERIESGSRVYASKNGARLN